MRRACLLVLIPLLLQGCAVVLTSDAMERDIESLRSGDMEDAIRAAKPGIPRQPQSPAAIS